MDEFDASIARFLHRYPTRLYRLPGDESQCAVFFNEWRRALYEALNFSYASFADSIDAANDSIHEAQDSYYKSGPLHWRLDFFPSPVGDGVAAFVEFDVVDKRLDWFAG